MLSNNINIKNNRKCIEEHCNISATYNYPDITKRLYCNIHKKDNMINIINRRCAEDNCKTIPCYNYKTGKIGIYCFKHKKDNMVNVKDKLCLEEGCEIKPSFNVPGKKVGKYCLNHKKEGMINVILDHCNEDGCITAPTYNYPNTIRAIYCSKHYKEGMIDIKHNVCSHNGCNIRASYNFSGETSPIYCSAHKHEDMIILHSKICKTPLCGINIRDKYDGYCFRCYVLTFPDKPNSRNYKTKEQNIVSHVTKEFNNITIIYDKHIQNGCSRRRPDIMIDLGYQVIIVEIDENQHKAYDCSCENKRLMEISQDVGHRPIIFIRFNPDSYINNKNISVSSCWGLDSKGLCVIKKGKVNEWEARLVTLNNTIKYWLENVTDKTIELIHLYYDGTV